MEGMKNPDRAISADKRTVADLRRANPSSPVEQYYRATVPAVAEIAHVFAQLQARDPSGPIALAERDISSAFRLPRLHPALYLVTITEFLGNFLGVDGVKT